MGLWSNPTSSGSGDEGRNDSEKARKWANSVKPGEGTQARIDEDNRRKRRGSGFWPGRRISETDGIKPKRRKRGLF